MRARGHFLSQLMESLQTLEIKESFSFTYRPVTKESSRHNEEQCQRCYHHRNPNDAPEHMPCSSRSASGIISISEVLERSPEKVDHSSRQEK